MERELPEFLLKKINEQYDSKIAEEIFNGLKTNKKTTFRINRVKSNVDEVTKVLNEKSIKFSKVEFFRDAFVLESNSENSIKKLDIYKLGKIYMQSVSSMIPVLVLNPKNKENILDMCAAPRREDNTNCKSNREYSICNSL